MVFADMGVDANVVSCNRVLLLHGPPGTGKTTILKGLAQKIAIRLGARYTAGQFVEINAHSLFSKVGLGAMSAWLCADAIASVV